MRLALGFRQRKKAVSAPFRKLLLRNDLEAMAHDHPGCLVRRIRIDREGSLLSVQVAACLYLECRRSGGFVAQSCELQLMSLVVTVETPIVSLQRMRDRTSVMVLSNQLNLLMASPSHLLLERARFAVCKS